MKRYLLLLVSACLITTSLAQKKITIGILNDTDSRETELYLGHLKKSVSDVLGSSNQVTFTDVLFNDFDLGIAKSNYQKLKDEADILLSFGIINTLMLYKEREKGYPKPVVIIGSINNDFIEIHPSQVRSLVNNLTYLITPFSYKEDLDIFATLSNFQKIGIVIDEHLLNLLPIKQLFNDYFSNKDINYEIIAVNESTNPETIKLNLDAIYLASHSSISNETLDQLIDKINQNNIPSLSSYGVRDVKKGILATNQPAINVEQIIRRVALNIEAINDGQNAAELPLHINYDKQLTINMTTASKIGYPIRNSMLAKVNLIEGDKSQLPDEGYTIVELMQEVLKENLSLENERRNIDLGKQDIKGARSQYLPDLTTNATATYVDPNLAEVANGQNPEFSTMGNVSVSQVIYSEQASANIDIQKSNLASQRENYNAAELDAVLNAAIAYYNTLVIKTNLSIQNKNLQMTKQNLDIANQNLELGASGRSDVLRFKSQLAQNTQGMIEARNTLNQAYYQINQLLNRPITADVDVKDTILVDSKDEDHHYSYLSQMLDDPLQKEKLTRFLIDEAKNNAPELKFIGFNKAIVDRNFRLNDKGRYIPTVALKGQYNHTFSKSGAGAEPPAGFPVLPDGHYNLGVSLSLPIFQQSTRNIKKQTALIQKDQLDIQKQDAELSIEKNVNDIVLELINEVANIEISKVDLNFSKESLELSQNEYQNGAIPVIQLIDAQNNFFKASIANSTAQYNYQIALMKLQRAIGYFFEINSKEDNDAFIIRAKQYILSTN